MVSFTPRSLYPLGKSAQCPLNRGLCGPTAGLEDLQKLKRFKKENIRMNTVLLAVSLKTAFCLRAAARHCVQAYECPCVVSQFAKMPFKYRQVSFGRVVSRRK